MTFKNGLISHTFARQNAQRALY